MPEEFESRLMRHMFWSDAPLEYTRRLVCGENAIDVLPSPMPPTRRASSSRNAAILQMRVPLRDSSLRNRISCPSADQIGFLHDRFHLVNCRASTFAPSS